MCLVICVSVHMHVCVCVYVCLCEYSFFVLSVSGEEKAAEVRELAPSDLLSLGAVFTSGNSKPSPNTHFINEARLAPRADGL